MHFCLFFTVCVELGESNEVRKSGDFTLWEYILGLGIIMGWCHQRMTNSDKHGWYMEDILLILYYLLIIDIAWWHGNILLHINYK